MDKVRGKEGCKIVWITTTQVPAEASEVGEHSHPMFDNVRSLSRSKADRLRDLTEMCLTNFVDFR